MMSLRPKDLYQRQTSLAELGVVGQAKITNARVVIIGCGGLGGAAAVYLAGSGIGHLHLIDFDQVDASNLPRQVYFTPKDIGKNKAKTLAQYLRTMNPFITVSHSKERIDKENILGELDQGAYIVDCTDHLYTKYLINDACVLKSKPLIYGSLYKFTGYVATFNALVNGKITGNLRDAFPEFPKEHIPNCAEIGTLNTIVGLIGIQQANEVLKLVTGLGAPLINQLLIYNSLTNQQHKIKYHPISTRQQIKERFESSTYRDEPPLAQNAAWTISAAQLKEALKNNRKVQIISVIEDISTSLPFEVSAVIPLSKFDELVQFIEDEMDQKQPIFIVCQRGISSYQATSKLKKINPALSVFSLTNGINTY